MIPLRLVASLVHNCKNVMMVRHLCIQFVVPKATVVVPDDKANRAPHERKIAALLEHQHFTEKQIKKVLRHGITKLFAKKSDLTVMEDALAFWKTRMIPPNLRDDDTEPINNKFDYRTVNVNYVLANEPDLLQISPEHMEARINKLKKIGFLSGQNELWRVFVMAPRAYYLQDWSQFLRKYHYMEHRVMDWLIDRKKDKYPSPHPFVRHCKVFELQYEHLKARFLFAQRTGLKAPSITSSLDNQVKDVSLGRLMLTDVDEYLAFVAPHCTEEEYLVFEQMIADAEDDDDEIINDLCELNALENQSKRPKLIARRFSDDNDDKKRLVQLDV